MTSLVEQVAAIATALDDRAVSWAFGGAIALAYATREPRGTRDIDVNVFVPAESADAVFRSLPAGVRHTAADIAAAHRDDQVRLYWDGTPVDVFFAADAFHGDVAQRCRVVPFAGTTIRVLCSEDLAVFKALFDRPKDWVDIATMADAGALDVALAASRLEQLIPGDDRVARLRSTDGL
jgi:pimeloyl-ACP methyl ester carboxylesterase